MGRVGSILEGLQYNRINESSKSYKNLTFEDSASLMPKGEFSKFFDDLSFVLSRFGKNYKAIVFYDNRKSLSVRIYGFSEDYTDEFDFSKLNDSKKMENHVKSVFKAFSNTIGKYDNIAAVDYWTAKVKVDGKDIQTGPYVEVEYDANKVYDGAGVSESKQSEVKCPKCGSKDIDHWEKNAYYCNSCGHEFDNKDLGIKESPKVNEKSELMDSYDVKWKGKTYTVSFYQDSHTGESTTQIDKRVSYDLEDYHYATSTDGQNFNLCRKGKKVKSIKLKFEEMSMSDVHMIIDNLIELDNKANLTPRIDRT
jgi:ribosomal protein L37AE/L43A